MKGWSGTAEASAEAAAAAAAAAQAAADAVAADLAALDTDDVANVSGVPGGTTTQVIDELEIQMFQRPTYGDLEVETNARIAADALLAPVASPTFTGSPAAPTPAPGTNTTRLATTAFVTAAVGVEAAARSAADALLAPLDSPNLSGTPTAPTASLGTSSTQIATTAFVVDTVDTAAALLAPKASPALTGTPTAPTAAPGTNTTQVATTAFVAAQAALLAPLASPALTGNPTAPTPASSDNDTSVATTAFVQTVAALRALAYNSGGATSGAKVWYGTATTDASGDWSVSVTSAGFTGSPVVLVTGELNTTTVTDQVWATVRTRSTSTIAGTAIRGVVLAALGATTRRAASGATVHVVAIGT